MKTYIILIGILIINIKFIYFKKIDTHASTKYV